MTYEARETSAWDGRKVFIYTWTRGAQVWRYVAADQDVVLDFQRYTHDGAIKHDTIEQGSEPIRSGIQVDVGMDHPVADLYRTTPPRETVMLLIQSYHVGDEAFRVPVWQGRITGVKWEPERARAVISHDPTYTSLRRTGLRRHYQRLCPLLTGGKRCGVNLELYATTGEVLEVNGLALTVPAIDGRPDDYYDGGEMVYEISSGVTERRSIRTKAGAVLSIKAFPTGLVPGMMVKLYPGDDHTADTCANKFNNIENYGGILYFPGKNPFGGSPIY
jgi:uncharacterized phage protein (TIGR02218 family)